MKKQYKKYKNRLEHFLSSEKGKRLFSFFYSWGASIVILGALFKLLHLPFGNQMLFIGMMTEFFVFFISAFEKPTKEYSWEEVFPVLNSKDPNERPQFGSGESGPNGTVVIGGGQADLSPEALEALKAQNGANPGAIGNIGGAFIGGGFSGGGVGNYSGEIGNGTISGGSGAPVINIPPQMNVSEEDTKNLSDSIKKLSAAAEQLSKMSELTEATQQCMSQLNEMASNMQRFGEVTNSLTDASSILLDSYQHVVDNSENIQSNSYGYIHQMESLNRNISGLNTIYEIQLKSISSQIDTIERINGGLSRIRDLYDGSITDSSVFKSETEKMAQQLAALNNIYARLLNAMTSGANPMYGGGYQNVQNPTEK
ncbi:MAG: gliding motility protein GldL [Bacteroidales bacterium]|nr:gliding motility protein GldL [Bacteroidales bacterium]